MSFWTLLLVAVGVSADAFAVSLSKGLAMPHFTWRAAWILGGAFGIAQAAMVLLGWVLASRFASFITGVDHWIAFVLLGLIGGKMLWEARSGVEESAAAKAVISVREVVVLAIATSIDALAVGIAFAFLDIDVTASAALIGLSTLAISMIGVRLGHRAGSRIGSFAEIIGGVILIGIGTRILLDHLGIW